MERSVPSHPILSTWTTHPAARVTRLWRVAPARAVVPSVKIENMCGRYANARRDDQLAQYFHVAEFVGPELAPSWNVAPTQDVRAVLEREEHDQAVRQLRTLRWGC